MLLINRLSTFRRLRQTVITSIQSRNFSSKDSKTPDKNSKKEGDKAAKPNTKKEDPCAANLDKNLTELKGGSKVPPKKLKFCPPEKNKKLSCQELILKREGKLNKSDGKLTSIRGGGPSCPCAQKPKPPIKAVHSAQWKRYSLFAALPIVAVLSLFVLTSHKGDERLEFKLWPNMYKREKTYFFYNGNRTLFHNKHINALPPGGYEDEVDEDAMGKEPETDAQKKDRLKQHADVEKKWKKSVKDREAQAKKDAAAAEKEAKRQEAEAAKEQKRQEAEAKKAAKAQEEEEKKAAKAQEAEEKKAAKAAKTENTSPVAKVFKLAEKAN